MANLEKIKDIAKLRGVSLDYIAKELDITPQALSKLMRENSTRITTLERIAQILKVSVRVFFEEESDVRLALAEQEGVAIVGDANNILAENERLISIIEKQSEQIIQLSNKNCEQMDRLLAIMEKLSIK